MATPPRRPVVSPQGSSKQKIQTPHHHFAVTNQQKSSDWDRPVPKYQVPKLNLIKYCRVVPGYNVSVHKLMALCSNTLFQLPLWALKTRKDALNTSLGTSMSSVTSLHPDVTTSVGTIITPIEMDSSLVYIKWLDQKYFYLCMYFHLYFLLIFLACIICLNNYILIIFMNNYILIEGCWE